MIASKTFKVLGVEHIGIAMDDNEKIESFLRLLPDMSYDGNETIDDQMVKTDIFSTNDAKIELLNSTSKDSTIEKYINKNGNGVHHIALRVDSLENAIKELSNNGIEFIDQKPRLGAEECMIAFIHPKSTGGILFELCQRPQ
tara:strand:+ start:627 stop:1052 length:426 start_codon:yes stop_codon:yes gene_type:complete